MAAAALLLLRPWEDLGSSDTGAATATAYVVRAVDGDTIEVRLNGRLEDHEHHVLTDQGIQVIRTQIERISAEMTNRGIVPGSATAMRLFS